MTNKDKYHSLCQTESTIPIFSRDWWLDTVCGEMNWEVLLIEEKERIEATMPLYIPHRGIVSMPQFTQSMGPWFAPEADDSKYTTRLSRRQNLCKALIESLRPFPHFLQNFHYQITDWLPFYWEHYSQTTRYTYVLPDLTDLSSLWANMSPNIRRNIVKARDKHGITVRKGIPVEEFIQVHQQTFKRQHMAVPQDIKILEALIQVCRQRRQGDLWGGYDSEGHLHAAVFIVWQESSAWYLAGGGNPSLRDSGAHSLVLWECIRQVAPFTARFDFEGSMLRGVERFFREFGAIQMPYFTISKGKLSLMDRAWLKLKKWI